MNKKDTEGLDVKILIMLYLKNKSLKESYKKLVEIKCLSDEENLNQIITELVKKGLVIGENYQDASLTTFGFYEVELAYLNPVHSNNVNIINIAQMVNSVIQQGSPNAAITISRDQLEELQNFIVDITPQVDVKIISKALIDGKPNVETQIRIYYKTLLEELEKFRINSFDGLNKDKPWGNKIEQSVQHMRALRDQFIELFKSIIENTSENKKELIHKLLEQLLQFNFSDYQYFDNRELAGYLRNENYRIFIYEVFLYTSAYLIKEERFQELSYILHQPYQVHLVDKSRGNNDYKMVDFTAFNIPTKLLDHELRRNLLGIYSPSESLLLNLLKSRQRVDISWQEVREVDVLLHFISLFSWKQDRFTPLWIPFLAFEKVERLDIMKKAVSKGFFERIKGIFSVDTFQTYKERYSHVLRLENDYYSTLHQYQIPQADIVLNPIYIYNQP